MLVSLRKNIRKGLRFTAIFAVIFILSLSPWIVRNYITFNVLSISSSPDYNILLLYVAPFVAEQQNQDIKIVYNSLRSEVEALMSQDGLDSHEFNRHDFRVTKYYRELGIKYIRNYPIDFVKHYAIGIVHFFFNLDTRVYAKYLGLPNAEIHIKGHTNVLILMKNWIRQKTLGEKVVGLWISLYLLICYISAAAGIFAGRKNYHKTFLLYSGITILYFVLITGTAGLARFRLPSIPFYLVFVGIGVVLLEKQLRRL